MLNRPHDRTDGLMEINGVEWEPDDVVNRALIVGEFTDGHQSSKGVFNRYPDGTKMIIAQCRLSITVAGEGLL